MFGTKALSRAQVTRHNISNNAILPSATVICNIMNPRRHTPIARKCLLRAWLLEAVSKACSTLPHDMKLLLPVWPRRTARKTRAWLFWREGALFIDSTSRGTPSCSYYSGSSPPFFGHYLHQFHIFRRLGRQPPDCFGHDLYRTMAPG